MPVYSDQLVSSLGVPVSFQSRIDILEEMMKLSTVLYRRLQVCCNKEDASKNQSQGEMHEAGHLKISNANQLFHPQVDSAGDTDPQSRCAIPTRHVVPSFCV